MSPHSREVFGRIGLVDGLELRQVPNPYTRSIHVSAASAPFAYFLGVGVVGRW